MKKVLLVILAIFVAGCAEKGEYEQAVAKQVANDKDVQDYKIDPEIMVKCIVETSSKKMPGFIAFDPERRKAYQNYAMMLNLYDAKDPKQTLDELRETFGSAKDLADAHRNYAESMVNCVSGLVTSEEEQMHK